MVACDTDASLSGASTPPLWHVDAVGERPPHQLWLTDDQMERLRPFFRKSRGKPRVDDLRVLSGIVFVNRNGLRWRDAPSAYGPHKTLYNRWKRWGERGVFTRMMEGLAAGNAEPKTVVIDATYLKAHRTASSLRVKKGISGA